MTEPETPPPRERDGLSAETANDAIRAVGTAAVSFVGTLFYIGVATVATTHAQLLSDHDLKLPLLDVEVPVLYFFRIASWMVVALHLLLLLQVYSVHARLRELPAKHSELLPSSVLASGLLRLEERLWVRRLIRLLLVGLLLLLPLALLAIIQHEFVPYHSSSTTWWFHQLPFLADLAVSLVLVPLILSPDARWSEWWCCVPAGSGGRLHGCIALLLFGIARLLVAGFLVVALAFCLFVAVVPGSWWDRWPEGVAGLGLERDLQVSGRQLVDAAAAQTFLDAVGERRSTHTLDLANRDLRNARMSGAALVGADLRGADLTGARLVGADLRGADLSPVRSGGGADPVGVALLAGADLRGADLRGARLPDAELYDADLSGADLRGAVLTGSDLRLADLTDTRLEAADLEYAVLRGASLDRARAACAVFYAVDGRGASAFRLRAPAADLRRARLQGARLVGAGLEAADLTGAAAAGGDFRGASLALSSGLVASAVDLRHADLSAAWIGALKERAPRNSDFRGAALSGAVAGLPAEIGRELGSIANGLVGFPEGRRRLEQCRARLRLQVPATGPRGTLEVGDALQRARAGSNLLDPEEGGAVSPAGGGSERRFHRRLIDALLGPDPDDPAATRAAPGEACGSKPLAASLVLRAWGCSPPRDPMLEGRLQERIGVLLGSPGSCPALDALRAVVSELPPPVDERGPRWRRPAALPRWPAPLADCSPWRRELRELVAVLGTKGESEG